MTSIGSSAELSAILADLNLRGGFAISVLTDTDGLLLASAAAPDWDAEKQAAVVALIRDAARHTEGARLGQADEVTVRDGVGRRLVCRPFIAGDQLLLLSVLVADGRPYRRLTNVAVREIRRLWGA
jgi:predicted regulator of Ras-like GTPase activity (Roadblock/LC7/MglB family)